MERKKLPTSLTCSSGQKIPQILRLQNMQQHNSTQRAFNSISHAFGLAQGTAQGLRRNDVMRYLSAFTGTIYIRHFASQQNFSQEKNITMLLRCDGNCCSQDAKLSLHIVMVHPLSHTWIWAGINQTRHRCEQFFWCEYVTAEDDGFCLSGSKSLLKCAVFQGMDRSWGFGFNVHMHRVGRAV